MHRILLLALLILLVNSLNIEANETIIFNDSQNYFDLRAAGAQGEVLYFFKAFPKDLCNKAQG